MEDKYYETVLGDTWDMIAYKLCGDSMLYNILLDLNEEYSDILIFGSGIKIKYKEIPKSYKENIAPWRR
ncbi:tail protein X [Fusobacterium ulcerans]